MRGGGSAAILIRNVPGDIVRALEARARANYRSRYGEILAILTEVCREGVAREGQDERLAPRAQDKAPAPLSGAGRTNKEGEI